MTNHEPLDPPAAADAALTALLTYAIIDPRLDDDAPIDSATLIDDIINDDDCDDSIILAIRDLAFDALDLDDDMLIDRIHAIIDNR